MKLIQINLYPQNTVKNSTNYDDITQELKFNSIVTERIKLIKNLIEDRKTRILEKVNPYHNLFTSALNFLDNVIFPIISQIESAPMF